MRRLSLPALAAAAFIAAPALADPLAEIAAGQEQAERRVERGFNRIDTQFQNVREGFRDVRAGFGAVEDELRHAVKRDASIAALAAIPSQPDGWSIGVGFAVEERHNAPGGAVSIGYRNDDFAFFAAASGPAPVFTVGISFRLK